MYILRSVFRQYLYALFTRKKKQICLISFEVEKVLKNITLAPNVRLKVLRNILCKFLLHSFQLKVKLGKHMQCIHTKSKSKWSAGSSFS